MSLLVYEVYWKANEEKNNETIRLFQSKRAAEAYALLLNSLDKISSFYSGENSYCVKPMEIDDEFENKFPVGVLMIMNIEKAGTQVEITRDLAVCKCDFIYDPEVLNENRVPIKLCIYKEYPLNYLHRGDTKITLSLAVPCKLGDSLEKLEKKAKTVTRRVLDHLKEKYKVTYDDLYNAFENEMILTSIGFEKVTISETVNFYTLEINGFKEE